MQTRRRDGLASAWLQVATYAPKLRLDVWMVPQDDTSFRIFDLATGRFIQLHGLECHLAQMMDGQRNIEALTSIAQQFNRGITRATIEHFVVEVDAVGLLESSHPVDADDRELVWQSDESIAFVRPPIIAPSSVAPLRVVKPPLYEGLDDAATMLEMSSMLEEQHVEVEPSYQRQIEQAPEEEKPQDVPGEEPREQAQQEEPQAQQEQEELWNSVRKKWHQRTSVRVLGVLVVLTAIAAVIPYPLRITAECTIIPTERATVRSELPGVIAEILVNEGQVVKKGDVIARLDTRALKSERDKTGADIDKLQADLSRVRHGHRPEEIAQARATLAARRTEADYAAKQARRGEEMLREGVGSKQAAEQASRDLASRSRAIAEAEAALKLLEAGARPEEIAAQEAEVKRAQVELAFVDEKLAMSAIRAPIDGTILTAHFKEHVNEGVEAGGTVCEIANLRRMRAEILVPERDVDVIEAGMPATVKVESFPTHPFEGKVDFVAPMVDDKDHRVRVVVELDNSQAMLMSNMTGYGEVETGNSSILRLATRRFIRWIRVRFLL
jgi:multidrug efflux pump subunit AcrA (membrane-fusion protein)